MGGVLLLLVERSPTERLKQTIRHVILEYPEHPCAVPNCPCMVHRLGLPQADVVVQTLLRSRPSSN
jgi:hypothetical protein